MSSPDQPGDSVPDYGDYADEQPSVSSDVLKRFGKLAAKMAMLELDVEDLEKQIVDKKHELAKYSGDILVEMMSEMGMKDVTTLGGLRVALHTDIRASFPKDVAKQEIAFAWLRKTGDEGLIKSEFTVHFPRDSTQRVEEFEKLLDDNKVADHAVVETGKTIHNQSLLKYLREQTEAGAEIPLEAFGAFLQRVAKIKRGK